MPCLCLKTTVHHLGIPFPYLWNILESCWVQTLTFLASTDSCPMLPSHCTSNRCSMGGKSYKEAGPSVEATLQGKDVLSALTGSSRRSSGGGEESGTTIQGVDSTHAICSQECRETLGPLAGSTWFSLCAVNKNNIHLINGLSCARLCSKLLQNNPMRQKLLYRGGR